MAYKLYSFNQVTASLLTDEVPCLQTGNKVTTWQKVIDLFAAFFLTKNVAITGATKTKITYDANGLVTSGADATTADITDSTNKRYQTDNQRTYNDATSSIQTQLNAKQASIVAVTGYGGNTGSTTRINFNSATFADPALAAYVGALITDLKAKGILTN